MHASRAQAVEPTIYGYGPWHENQNLRCMQHLLCYSGASAKAQLATNVSNDTPEPVFSFLSERR